MSMSKAEAAKALRELDCLHRSFVLEDKGPSCSVTPKAREAARAELQRLRAAHKRPYSAEIRKAIDDAFSVAQCYRYSALTLSSAGGIQFACVQAQGDSWTDLVADYARKREADRKRYAKQ